MVVWFLPHGECVQGRRLPELQAAPGNWVQWCRASEADYGVPGPTLSELRLRLDEKDFCESQKSSSFAVVNSQLLRCEDRNYGRRLAHSITVMTLQPEVRPC